MPARFPGQDCEQHRDGAGNLSGDHIRKLAKLDLVFRAHQQPNDQANRAKNEDQCYWHTP